MVSVFQRKLGEKGWGACCSYPLRVQADGNRDGAGPGLGPVDTARCTVEESALSQMRRHLDRQFGDRHWVFNEAAGPLTQREFLAFLCWTEGQPA